MQTIGNRKFYSVAGTTILVLGLSFWGLLVDKLNGSEFVSSVTAICVLVGGFCGINIAGKVFGKDDSP